MKLLFFLLVLTATAAQGEIYKWSDRSGVVHYSNSMDDIPDRFRARAKSMNYGGDQKVEPQTGQNQSSAPPAPAVESQGKQISAPVRELPKKEETRRRSTRGGRHVQMETDE